MENKKPKKNRVKEMEIEEKAIDACAKYLRSKGWNPLVGGFQRIEQGELKYNFRLIFGFTGKPPKEIKLLK